MFIWDSPIGSFQTYYVEPARRRLQSLSLVNPRIRSNSVTIYNDDGEDIAGTSFGPVMLQETHGESIEWLYNNETTEICSGRHDWLLGWFLAIISGILFTANNFFVKYLNVDAIEMLLIRSGLQTIILGVMILSTTRKFLPDAWHDKVLVILQVNTLREF